MNFNYLKGLNFRRTEFPPDLISAGLNFRHFGSNFRHLSPAVLPTFRHLSPGFLPTFHHLNLGIFRIFGHFSPLLTLIWQTNCNFRMFYVQNARKMQNFKQKCTFLVVIIIGGFLAKYPKLNFKS